jgi:hypothetical protein
MIVPFAVLYGRSGRPRLNHQHGFGLGGIFCSASKGKLLFEDSIYGIMRKYNYLKSKGVS